MSAKPSLIVGACVILGCLILGLSFGLPAAGQLAVPPAAGRYQVVVTPGQGSDTVYVFEPATGQCWYRSTAPAVKEWTDMGSPAIKTSK